MKMKPNSKPCDSLDAFESEIIQMLIDFGRIVGLQKSVCEIYGLLMSVIEPISMEEICQRLNMSLGSVSQGLKVLKDLGAVRPIQVEGNRKDYYQAEFNFREIVTKYLSDKIQPTLESAEERFAAIDGYVSQLPAETQKDLSDRVGSFRKLNRRAKQIIPAISKILSL